MNIFVITLLLIFPTLFSLSSSLETNSTPFCDLKYSPFVKIISIFNLGPDLILQIYFNESFNGEVKGYSYWRVYGTNERPVDGNWDDNHDRASIDQRIKDRIYKMSKFNQEIDSLGKSFNASDNTNNTSIKSDQRIFATTLREYEVYNLMHKCDEVINGNDDYEKERCEQFYSHFSSDLFCVFGDKFGYGLPVLYEPPMGPDRDTEAEHLKPGSPLVVVHRSCNEWDSSISMLFINSLSGVRGEITFHVFKMGDNVFMRVTDLENNNFTYSELVNPQQVYYIFKFNAYYRVLSCPKDCTFESPLFIIWYDTNAPEGNRTVVTPTDLTLNKMLGCQRKCASFDPNSFCVQEKLFKTVLGFGNDLLFQQTGRFWRHNSLGFNKESDNKTGPKVQSLRFDSHMAYILEERGIDTSYKVMGFPYDLGRFELCAGDRDCERIARRTKAYHRLCIFGVTNKPRNVRDLTLPRGFEFIYTPSGLKWVNQTTHGDGCQEFVSDLDQDAIKKFKVSPAGLKTIAYMEPSSVAEKQYGPHVWTIYHNTSNNEVYIMISYIQHSHDPREAMMQEHPVHNYFGSIDSIADTNVTTIDTSSVFVVNNILYLYHNSRLNLLRAQYENFNSVWHLFGYEIILNNEWGKLSWPFYKFMKCPFNSSASLLAVKRELVCNIHQNTSLAESLFVIGEHFYYQLGQHFYKFNDFNRYHFSYDEYVSDLFNDYFDTKHRVTGMSVPNTFDGNITDYEVVIHGKSRPDYRHIGEYIYAVFTMNVEEGLLIASKGGDDSHFNGKVFGVGAYKGADYFVDSLALWTKDPTKPVLVWISHFSYTDDSATDDHKLWMYYTTDPNFDFMFADTFSLKNWTKISLGDIGSSDLPFDKIIGIHGVPQNVLERWGKDQFDGNPLLFTARKFDNPSQVYYSNRDAQVVSKHQVDFQKFKEKVFIGFGGLFCLNPQTSDSGSNKGSTMKTILAVLILIVLVMVLVIAFYSNRVNRKQIDQKIWKSKAMETNKTSQTSK